MNMSVKFVLCMCLWYWSWWLYHRYGFCFLGHAACACKDVCMAVDGEWFDVFHGMDLILVYAMLYTRPALVSLRLVYRGVLSSRAPVPLAVASRLASYRLSLCLSRPVTANATIPDCECDPGPIAIRHAATPTPRQTTRLTFSRSLCRRQLSRHR